MTSDRWAQRYSRPDGTVTYGTQMTLDAVLLGDPDFGGVCPGYTHVGYGLRVAGGWWRTKGEHREWGAPTWRKGQSPMTEHVEIQKMTEEDIRAYGFEPWDGTKEGPPADWLRDWKVLHEGGFVGSLNVESSYPWEHTKDEDGRELNIIGYPTRESIRNATRDISDYRKRSS